MLQASSLSCFHKRFKVTSDFLGRLTPYERFKVTSDFLGRLAPYEIGIQQIFARLECMHSRRHDVLDALGIFSSGVHAITSGLYYLVTLMYLILINIYDLNIFFKTTVTFITKL